MADVRAAILNAVLEADRLHKEFDTKARADRGEGRINVFEMLVNRHIPVMFQPLKGLLGAFLKEDEPGVLVTTQRQLPGQLLWTIPVCLSFLTRNKDGKTHDLGRTATFRGRATSCYSALRRSSARTSTTRLSMSSLISFAVVSMAMPLF